MCCRAWPYLVLQIGGSDQWGNIIAGTDLARKLLGWEGEEDGKEDANSQTCYGLTFPLLVRGLCISNYYETRARWFFQHMRVS